jgi:ligand-binding SRPBCC domain-containing protein
MPRLVLRTAIDMTPEDCFDRVREPSDRPVSLGQTIKFESRVLGVRQELVMRVMELERPRRFVDAMVSGRFKSFVHIHEFETAGMGTQLTDTIIWESPFGVLGRLADRLFLKGKLGAMVGKRNTNLTRTL